MFELTTADWLVAVGFGCIWAGALIWLNSGNPRQLRRGEQPSAKPGSEHAFLLFWLDQYAYIGIGLCLVGSTLGLFGAFA